ncbi:hypothetical protein [Aurantimonas sp. Leaf443]|uniref:hypothetical protein n=1 Tax=Aurantimonas sp. Leaf443 TaxID=1736378 RepID=UPI0006F4D049|nr:hypothetical protein [Aurantimonas sp. Leaf443]KQT83392.1 hypothetical protein ASG48_12565 [Aurantimonas sp. Leaf443]
MVTTFIRNACLAVAIAATGLVGTVLPAAAQDVRFGITIGDGRPDYHRGYDRHDRRSHYRPAPVCGPQQAENKADRMGLRRTRVVDVSRRSIVVQGRSRGDRATVRFARAPGCPVISFRN